MTPELILASGSAGRKRLLSEAGLRFHARPSAVDEAALKQELAVEGLDPAAVAMRLAEAKAVSVSRHEPEAWVLGCDQVLAFDGIAFDKPRDAADLHAQLRRLRGRTHELISAACLARGGTVVWRCEDRARLTMRNFSDAFLEAYVARNVPDVLQAVGGYFIEAEGLQLFEAVEGHSFTIVGLPLLHLLAQLREIGILPS